MHLVASGTMNQPSEALEHRFPILIETYGLRTDSGGPGRNRGGLGIVREIRLLDDVSAVGSGDRQDFTPYGVFGGGHAAGTEWAVERGGERQELPPRFEKVALEEGDLIRYASPGGGGYGPAGEREPERIRADIESGYITAEAARRDYGEQAEATDDLG
jgi:N-methylhydantoinase B